MSDRAHAHDRATRSGRVELSDTAAAFGDDFPAAASTPFVLGLAEVACHDVVASDLAEDQITVGVDANIQHLAPSPVGVELIATAELVKREGRRFTFDVQVSDRGQTVAKIVHRRVAVSRSQIQQRLESGS